MVVVYAAMQVVGAVLCVVAARWAWRTRHQRRVWRNTRHDTARVAIVLELEEKVRELELESAPAESIDIR